MNAAQILAYLPQILSLIGQAAQLVPAAGAVPKYLDLLAQIVGQGEKAYRDLDALRALVADMVAQHREPTADEWASLRGRSAAAHEAIQAVDLSGDAANPSTGA